MLAPRHTQCKRTLRPCCPLEHACAYVQRCAMFGQSSGPIFLPHTTDERLFASETDGAPPSAVGAPPWRRSGSIRTPLASAPPPWEICVQEAGHNLKCPNSSDIHAHTQQLVQPVRWVREPMVPAALPSTGRGRGRVTELPLRAPRPHKHTSVSMWRAPRASDAYPSLCTPGQATPNLAELAPRSVEALAKLGQVRCSQHSRRPRREATRPRMPTTGPNNLSDNPMFPARKAVPTADM